MTLSSPPGAHFPGQNPPTYFLEIHPPTTPQSRGSTHHPKLTQNRPKTFDEILRPSLRWGPNLTHGVPPGGEVQIPQPTHPLTPGGEGQAFNAPTFMTNFYSSFRARVRCRDFFKFRGGSGGGWGEWGWVGSSQAKVGVGLSGYPARDGVFFFFFFWQERRKKILDPN